MNFRRASYRTAIEKQPVGGVHRRFTISALAARPGPVTRQMFGVVVERIVNLDLVVRVAYTRMGGSMGIGPARGDRIGVTLTASDDTMLIADALTDVRNWDPTNTKIRRVDFVGMEKVIDKPMVEVWQIRLTCEYIARWDMG